ncbi:zeta toxin family protein [Rhodococcus sp. BP-349]|jgi:predicted ABC-type ATPase|uniref:zeta toxin family protein n=1 Tax=unclassified Rhodococcus (in: high G+C Gram-positive bacteria) TaxID=192944 RepID=UPI001C9AFCCA|nr:MULTISPECIES: zeta toxin family protein [unclassified Rhodococcus (in: high G+C Gram-positive bacteria)]MBY6540083.1 zeta toxin family protein [Rhodococcus sp. BP-363]MBY6543589.1 zeta toxin family protein [Rhodococcus sp. BP-369]MBY6562819.1 zeta toxin family protein [Rhodococcus sp. BP-370]MBY6577111.1 zeta toxin family protein [Rhodococcus sp. BP-364]MBY6586412.1 zeta toxin family protein [Rhodococcus sp. BP-358]
MTRDPVLHLLAGPNGAGKSTFFARVLAPVTHLPFVNADEIATETWPGDEQAHAYDASRLAAEQRVALLAQAASFVTETVFSHPSKLDLIETANEAGYLVTLHIVAIPVDLAVARVVNRVEIGGHSVPEAKVRERYVRLWPLVRSAIDVVENARVYDNTNASNPFRVIARYDHGRLVGDPSWPSWAPAALMT